MSGLAALLAGHNPPDVYQWHSAAHVPDVEHAVEHAGWRFVYLDGWTVEDTESFVKSTGAAFGFPDQLGAELDELAGRLAGVGCGDQQGLVLLWDGWSPFARHDEQAFNAALGLLGARSRAEGPCKLAVLLRGEGPPLDVPELPHKH